MKENPKPKMIEVAKNAGLEVEFLDGMPAAYDGHLDPHDEPRYIGVNRSLPLCDQSFTIAREIGFFAQQRRCRSFVFDRPWKWELLANAPEEIRQKICLLDAESRANLFMLFQSTGDEYRAFVKRNPRKSVALLFADTAARFHLLTLRIQTWIYKVFYVLALS